MGQDRARLPGPGYLGSSPDSAVYQLSDLSKLLHLSVTRFLHLLKPRLPLLYRLSQHAIVSIPVSIGLLARYYSAASVS